MNDDLASGLPVILWENCLVIIISRILLSALSAIFGNLVVPLWLHLGKTVFYCLVLSVPSAVFDDLASGSPVIIGENCFPPIGAEFLLDVTNRKSRPGERVESAVGNVSKRLHVAADHSLERKVSFSIKHRCTGRDVRDVS